MPARGVHADVCADVGGVEAAVRHLLLDDVTGFACVVGAAETHDSDGRRVSDVPSAIVDEFFEPCAELLAFLLAPPRLVLQCGAPLRGFEQPLLQRGDLRGGLVQPFPFLVHASVGLGQGIRELLIFRRELGARALVEGLRACLVGREPPALSAPLLAGRDFLRPVAEDEEEDVGDAREIPRGRRLQLQRARIPEVVQGPVEVGHHLGEVLVRREADAVAVTHGALGPQDAVPTLGSLRGRQKGRLPSPVHHQNNVGPARDF